MIHLVNAISDWKALIAQGAHCFKSQKRGLQTSHSSLFPPLFRQNLVRAPLFQDTPVLAQASILNSGSCFVLFPQDIRCYAFDQ